MNPSGVTFPKLETGRICLVHSIEAGRNSTGLGLSIAKLLTERMGETIAADYSDGILNIHINFALD